MEQNMIIRLRDNESAKDLKTYLKANPFEVYKSYLTKKAG